MKTENRLNDCPTAVNRGQLPFNITSLYNGDNAVLQYSARVSENTHLSAVCLKKKRHQQLKTLIHKRKLM